MIDTPLTWTEVDRIRTALFTDAGAPLFAVVDGARSPRIAPLVESARLPHTCLYDGELSPRLAEAAPRLVALTRDATFTSELIAHGWSQAWGIFVESHAPLDELRAHLRTLLRVTDAQQRRLLFRYYDPRVLRVYLPTCRAHEARTVFGPIRRFCLEGASPRDFLDFSVDGGEVKMRATTLS